MPIILLRHGSAGSQETWHGDDTLRPLDGLGQDQARALVDGLALYGIVRIMSSPHARCVETVEPLAARLELPIEERDELADGAPVTGALALLEEVDGDGVVLVCTHRSVITDLIGPERPCRKGGAWILEATPDGFAPAVYLQEP
jgi:8-oxo-(d)GTP phosphatase